MIRLLFLFGVLCSFSACYDRIEACLDEYAANYDVSSDDACTDCCTFPSLTMRFTQLLGDSLFAKIDTITNDLGQMYIVEDVRFYLSDIAIYQEGNPLIIRQHIATEDNQTIIKNDMKIIKSSDGDVSFGTIRAFGTFDSLTCHFGLSEVMTNTTFVNLPSNHVLQPLVRLKDNAGQQAYLTMKYKRISPVRDTVSQIISVTQKPDFPPITLRKPVQSVRGNPIIFDVKADYKVLLQNQNLNMSADSLSKMIYPNMAKIIKVE